MIPHKQENDFQSSGLTNEVQAYSFQMGAEMAAALSDGIYTDKPTACWRELLANAYDSHRDAGNPDPPTVHMCTALEPWVNIEDFGVGMDADDFKDSYTSYGGSTKRGTNVTVGHKGLGSKVFFAYTSQATIICIKDGVKRTYSMFKDKDGMPSFNMMNKVPTNEHNGVKVSFGVLPGDIQDFQETAKQVFRRYDPTPIIEGMDEFVPEPYETIMVGNGWVMRKEEAKRDVYGRGVGKAQPYAIQGNIAYPIDANLLKSSVDASLHFMLEVPFDITFPIGALEAVTSREGLSYTPSTIAAIVARLKAMQNEIRNTIIPQIFAGCATKWAATKALATFMGDIDNKQYKKLLRDTAEWNGQFIGDVMEMPWQKYYDEETTTPSPKCYAINERRFSLQTLSFTKEAVSSYSGIPLYGRVAYLVILSDNTEKRIPSRLKQYMEETYGEASRGDRWDREKQKNYPIVLLFKGEAASMPGFKKLLQGHEWHNFDTLIPEYPTVRAARGQGIANRGPVERRVVKYNGRTVYDSGGKQQWDDVTLNTQPTGVYVNLRKWEPHTQSPYVGYSGVGWLRTLAIGLGLIAADDLVYGVPGGQKNELEPLAGWHELTEMIDKCQQKWEKSTEVAKEVTYTTMYKDTRRIAELSDYFKDNKIMDSGPIKTFLARVPLDTSDKIRHHIHLANSADTINTRDLFDETLKTTIMSEFDAVNIRYPMLSYLDLSVDALQDIKNYIELVQRNYHYT